MLSEAGLRGSRRLKTTTCLRKLTPGARLCHIHFNKSFWGEIALLASLGLFCGFGLQRKHKYVPRVEKEKKIFRGNDSFVLIPPFCKGYGKAVTFNIIFQIGGFWKLERKENGLVGGEGQKKSQILLTCTQLYCLSMASPYFKC